ncbi:MAG TPA: NUDIX hydrolase [Pseudolabrys sp.]|jgi:ADP-ribose pyrophosphatase
MRDAQELADRTADAAVSQPELLAKGYRDYWRYRLALRTAGGATMTQERDILLAGKVVIVLPIDLARDEIILLRQFRLPAHLANNKGDVIEFVAGRVESNETLIEAARRECREEIGVAPRDVIELCSYLTSAGLTDEEVTFFLAAVDASQIREGAYTTPDGEQLVVLRVTVDAALAALARGGMHSSLTIIALQWLALNRGRLAELLGAAR